MNKLNEEILAKFLMGECTEDELREVNAWLKLKNVGDICHAILTKTN